MKGFIGQAGQEWIAASTERWFQTIEALTRRKPKLFELKKTADGSENTGSICSQFVKEDAVC